MESMIKPVRDSVFISYCREDKKYLEEFHAHLKHYIRLGKLSSWDDTAITAGKLWYKEIERALQSTKVAVFLVSANSIASDFIYKYEMTPLLEAAREEGVIIMPIILSFCVFGSTDLKDFQAINDPSEPLNMMSLGKRNQVWVKAVKAIVQVL